MSTRIGDCSISGNGEIKTASLNVTSLGFSSPILLTKAEINSLSVLSSTFGAPRVSKLA